MCGWAGVGWVGGVPQTHSPFYLFQMHKTLADPAVDLSVEKLFEKEGGKLNK